MMHFHISKNERRYLEDGISQGIRNDGRGYMDYRPCTVETGVLPSTNGSARVCSVDTDIVIGVKCEMGTPDEERPAEGEIKITVDCPASVGFEMESKGRDSLGYYLSDLLTELCTSPGVLNKSILSVLPHYFCWYIYVDVTVLKVGGCLSDVISIGIRAALADTIIPRVTYYEKTEREDTTHLSEYQLEVDDRESAGMPFPIDAFPICVTVGQIGDRFLWDMSLEEQACVDAMLSVAVDKDGRCVGLHKSGLGVLDLASLYTLIQSSQVVGGAIVSNLDSTVQALRHHRKDGFYRKGFMG